MIVAGEASSAEVVNTTNILTAEEIGMHSLFETNAVIRITDPHRLYS